jgi:hypothetical protein
MYKMLLWLYEGGKLTDTLMANAVIKGYITEAQKQEILGTSDSK